MSVAVYAATGWTGRLVCRALQDARLPFSIVGRNADKLARLRAQLPCRPVIEQADAGDLPALTRAFSSHRVVVNCAAPAIDSGSTIIAACLAAGSHYVDVSGEESFVVQARNVHHHDARRRGLLVCPALAAKGALGDWGMRYAASLLPGRRRPDEVAVAYAHALHEYIQATTGSVISAAGQGFFRARHFDGSDRPLARRFAFPPPFGSGWGLLFPGAEDISIPRHLDVGRVESYLSVAPGSPVNEHWASLSLATLPWVPAISRMLVTPDGRRLLSTILPQSRRAGPEATFAAAIEAREGDAVVRLGIAATDAYAVTADIVAYGVERILADAHAKPGVCSPGEVLSERAALRALVERGAMTLVRTREQP